MCRAVVVARQASPEASGEALAAADGAGRLMAGAISPAAADRIPISPVPSAGPAARERPRPVHPSAAACSAAEARAAVAADIPVTRRQPPDPDIQLVTVLSTTDAAMVAVAKSVLEGAGIDYVVRGERYMNVMGWGGPGVFNSALGKAEFQVREADAPDASRLLARLKQSHIAPVPDQDD
jgi:hypothetical protein